MFQKFYMSAWTQNKACFRNSIRLHGHKIRHVKEIPYVSMESKEIPYVSMESKEMPYVSMERKEIPCQHGK